MEHIIGSTFVLLFILERIFRLRKFQRSFTRRLLVNFTFSALVFVASSTFVKPAIARAFGHSGNFGLLERFHLPSIGEFLIAFLLLDLSFYYWHKLNHKVSFLWRFHVVHHSDVDMDTSTAFRFHFIEVALSSIFRFFQVLLIGMSLEAFYFYELVFVVATIFHHSNLALPVKLEMALSWILVTPRLHELHHSTRETENSSNYSVVLSMWDRLHSTLSQIRERRLPDIGIPYYSQPKDQLLKELLKAPFKKKALRYF